MAWTNKKLSAKFRMHKSPLISKPQASLSEFPLTWTGYAVDLSLSFHLDSKHEYISFLMTNGYNTTNFTLMFFQDFSSKSALGIPKVNPVCWRFLCVAPTSWQELQYAVICLNSVHRAVLGAHCWPQVDSSRYETERPKPCIKPKNTFIQTKTHSSAINGLRSLAPVGPHVKTPMRVSWQQIWLAQAEAGQLTNWTLRGEMRSCALSVVYRKSHCHQ